MGLVVKEGLKACRGAIHYAGILPEFNHFNGEKFEDSGGGILLRDNKMLISLFAGYAAFIVR